MTPERLEQIRRWTEGGKSGLTREAWEVVARELLDALETERAQSAQSVTPRHIHLAIDHQPHAVMYMTVAEWLEDRDTEHVDINDADREEMLRTGEVWVVTWYPDTPVGFNSVAAATLDRALEIANGGIVEPEPAP
jgi:hypothetical protein